MTAVEMFFVASKLLGFFAVPSNDMLATGLIGLALIPTRFVRTGRRLVSASIILFLAFGLLPLSKMLIAPLEERFRHGTLQAARRTASWCWAVRSRRQLPPCAALPSSTKRQSGSP